MVNKKAIAPHVPVWGKTKRSDGTLSSSDFRWDEQANEYRCPQGQPLRSEWRIFKRSRTRITKANTIIYHATQAACAQCPMKAQCCPNTPHRKIARSIHEAARDVTRDLAKTEAYQQSRKDRKKVEMLFAHLKCILKLSRLRLRGLTIMNSAGSKVLLSTQFRRNDPTYDDRAFHRFMGVIAGLEKRGFHADSKAAIDSWDKPEPVTRCYIYLEDAQAGMKTKRRADHGLACVVYGQRCVRA